MCHNQPLGAGVDDDGCKCFGMFVIEKVHHVLLEHWYDNCPFETDEILRLQKQEVKDLLKYSSQLVT